MNRSLSMTARGLAAGSPGNGFGQDSREDNRDEPLTDGRRTVLPAAVGGPADRVGARYAVAAIKTIEASHPHWASPVLVTIRNRDGVLDVVGIERPSQSSEAN